MRTRLVMVFAFGVSGLAGCATTSDVIPAGRGTFMVAAQGVNGNGSAALQKAEAMKAAGNYCQKQGKQLQVIRAESTDGGFGRAPSGEVQFTCVAP